MTDYPKYYAKGASRKVSHSVREDVRLEFAGYRVLVDEPETKPEEAKLSPAELDEQPQLPLAELVAHPAAKDAEVVDVTDSGEEKPTDAELKANEVAKAANPQAYLAKQKSSGRPVRDNPQA